MANEVSHDAIGAALSKRNTLIVTVGANILGLVLVMVSDAGLASFYAEQGRTAGEPYPEAVESYRLMFAAASASLMGSAFRYLPATLNHQAIGEPAPTQSRVYHICAGAISGVVLYVLLNLTGLFDGQNSFLSDYGAQFVSFVGGYHFDLAHRVVKTFRAVVQEAAVNTVRAGLAPHEDREVAVSSLKASLANQQGGEEEVAVSSPRASLANQQDREG